jgi:hypothetical protein
MPLIPLRGVGDMLRSSLRRRSPLKVMQTVRHIRATRRIARNPPANMDTASSAMALGTICRRKLRKSSVRRSLMLIAFDRDRSDRYPGAVYSHLIAFARCAGWLRTNVCRSVVEFLNRWLSGEINTVGRIKNDEALFVSGIANRSIDTRIDRPNALRTNGLRPCLGLPSCGGYLGGYRHSSQMLAWMFRVPLAHIPSLSYPKECRGPPCTGRNFAGLVDQCKMPRC